VVVAAAVVSSAAVAVRMDAPEAVIKSDDDGVTNCDPVPPSGWRTLTVQMSREAAARLSRVGACVCVTTRGSRQRWWQWCVTGRLYVVVHKDCNASFYHRAAAAELSPAGGGGDGSGGGDEGRWWFCAAAVVEDWPLCYAIVAAESVENRMGTSPRCGGG